MSNYKSYKELSNNMNTLSHNTRNDRLKFLQEYWSNQSSIEELWFSAAYEPYDINAVNGILENYDIINEQVIRDLLSDLQNVKIPFVVGEVLVRLHKIANQDYTALLSLAPDVLSHDTNEWNGGNVAPILLDLAYKGILKEFNRHQQDGEEIDKKLKELQEMLGARNDGWFLAFHYATYLLRIDKHPEFMEKFLNFYFDKTLDDFMQCQHDEKFEIFSFCAALSLINASNVNYSRFEEKLVNILVSCYNNLFVNDCNLKSIHWTIVYNCYYHMRLAEDFRMWERIWNKLSDYRYRYSFDEYNPRYSYVGQSTKFLLLIGLGIYAWLLDEQPGKTEEFWKVLYDKARNLLYCYSDDSDDFYGAYIAVLLSSEPTIVDKKIIEHKDELLRIACMPLTFLHAIAAIKSKGISIKGFLEEHEACWKEVFNSLDTIASGDEYKKKLIDHYRKIVGVC